MLAPNAIKYETKSGKYYIYDQLTNNIVSVGKTGFSIIDDFCVLNVDELIEKHRLLKKTNVYKALEKLSGLQCRDILSGHAPRLPLRVNHLVWQGKKLSMHDYLKNCQRMLTLEITQKCNLQCDYCCFGKHYDGFRKHSDETMSFENAKKAILNYISCFPAAWYLGFYGGEALLEFGLVKQIVSFVEELGIKNGVEPMFHLTTNGTLLDEETIHYLVEHGFVIFISLDGTKETHDRYRVFRNNGFSEKRIGSYDVVMKNILRFIELYPNYHKRGLGITLTATSNFDGINDLLKQFGDSFPLTAINNVITPDSLRRADHACSFGVSSCGLPSCEENECNKNQTMMFNNSPKNQTMFDSHEEKIEFADWSKKKGKNLKPAFVTALEELSKSIRPKMFKKQFPLFHQVLRRKYATFHSRKIFEQIPTYFFSYRCFPTVSRTFCSSQGTFYPCERTERGKLFEMGNVHNGIDAKRAVSLIEIARLLGDCGNCIARQCCTMCPATIVEEKGSGRPDALAFQSNCKKIVHNFRRYLAQYTELIEINQKNVNKILTKIAYELPWNDSAGFLPPEEPTQEQVGIEELVEII